MRASGLWQKLLQVVASEGAHAHPYRRATVPVPVRGLQSSLLPQRRAVAAQADAYRRKKVRLHRLPETLHEERSLGQARETSHQGQVVHVVLLQRSNFRFSDDSDASEGEPVAGAGAAIDDASAATVHTTSAGGLRHT